MVGDHVYIGTSRRLYDAPGPDNFFFKLDRNLRKVWELPLGEDEVRGGAALDAAGRIYFVLEKGRRKGDASQASDLLTAVSPEGTILWQFDITSRAFWTRNDVGMFNPAVGADGTVYVAGARLYALDATGRLKWAYDGGWIVDPMDSKGGPVIDADGNIPDEGGRGGLLLSWVSPAVNVGAAGLDRIQFLFDVAAGKNWFGGIGAGVALQFSRAIALKTGPMMFLDWDLYENAGLPKWLWSVQMDVDVDLRTPKAATAPGS